MENRDRMSVDDFHGDFSDNLVLGSKPNSRFWSINLDTYMQLDNHISHAHCRGNYKIHFEIGQRLDKGKGCTNIQRME